MASKSLDMFCGTCERRSRNTKAVKYCTDCEDGFCSECLDFHGNMKVATSHHVIDIKVVDVITFNISKFCKVHSVMVLEYFCSDHDTLCCRSCIASYHRSCDRLLPIEVAAKDVKSSTMYEEIVKDVNALNITVIELADKKEKSVSTLDDSKVKVQQEVQCFQKRLHTRIQEIEVALMCEIDKVHNELSDKTKVDLKKICDRKIQIRNISEQFESVSKHGSDTQIFMWMNNIKDELNGHAIEFPEFLSSQNAAFLLYKESDLLSVMTSFGTVEVKETSFDIKYKPFMVQQAQLLQEKIKFPTKFQLDIKFKLPSAYVAGIGATKDNRLFLCDGTSSKLFVMSDKGRQLTAIKMDGRQWGIAMEEDKNIAWVTLPDTPCIQAVDIITMEKGQQINVPGKCYGIALINDEIAVGGDGKIYIISKTGDLKKTIDVARKDVTSISVGQNHQLYFAQGDIAESKLKCARLEDGKVTSISTQCTNHVIDVKADRLGNVYILESETSNFKLFCFEDKSLKTILTTNDGLKKPFGFAFSTDFSKLFISIHNDSFMNNEILVYKCN